MYFCVLIFHVYILFREISALVFCPFWIACLFIIVELWFSFYLYILDTSPLLDIWFTKIFSWFVDCLLIILTGSFEEKMFSFDKVQLTFFFLMDHTFNVKSKNSSLTSYPEYFLLFFLWKVLWFYVYIYNPFWGGICIKCEV